MTELVEIKIWKIKDIRLTISFCNRIEKYESNISWVLMYFIYNVTLYIKCYICKVYI